MVASGRPRDILPALLEGRLSHSIAASHSGTRGARPRARPPRRVPRRFFTVPRRPGAAGWMTLTLAPGHEPRCNLAGRYGAGMFTELTVTS